MDWDTINYLSGVGMAVGIAGAFDGVFRWPAGHLPDPDYNVFLLHRSSVVDVGAKIGKDTMIWHFCHVMPRARVGARCNIGQNCFIDNEAVIGDGCKLQNNVSIYRKVELHDEVFVGPSAVFTNVHKPRAAIKRDLDAYDATVVEKGATIGANATIICGARIRAYAIIGAGALITPGMEVKSHEIWVGNPARCIGRACFCGEKVQLIENGNPVFDGDADECPGMPDHPIECAACGRKLVFGDSYYETFKELP